MMNEWKTIESAPLNTKLIIWGGAAVRFGILDEMGNWRAVFHGRIKVKPTHWMPLPLPPKE